jgi:hypothetical protein
MGFLRMHDPVREFVKRADVIQVRVCRHRAQCFIENVRRRSAQTRDAHPRVDEQIAGAAPNVPDVTLHDPNDVGLPDPGHPIRQVLEFELASGDL